MSIDPSSFEPKRPEFKPPRRIREGYGPVKPEPPWGHIEPDKPNPLVLIGLLMVVIQIAWIAAMLIMKLYGIE